MKTLIWNVVWLIALTVVAYLLITKFQEANNQCLNGITRIEDILKTWELQLN